LDAEPVAAGVGRAQDRHQHQPRDGAQDAQKNTLAPWRKQRFCIPERDSARFVAQMEQVLDLYAQPPDDAEPLICMDEAAKELHGQTRCPLPMSPGKPLREDDKYERHGSCAIFMFFDPHSGWRRACTREHRTRVDWAQELAKLLEQDYPNARKIHLVCDNLNTHHIASLYEAFPAEQAHRLARRLDITYTPRNGSWLNVAEIELSILSKQCTSRRIADQPTLQDEMQRWTKSRNQERHKVIWQFTTPDARNKLRHLYPQF